MSLENQFFGGPGSGQTPDMLRELWCIPQEPRGNECTFSIDHHVIEDYQKYCCQLAYGFYKIHRSILPGSQKTPESIRRVNMMKKV